jgi:hypothetical protein
VRLTAAGQVEEALQVDDLALRRHTSAPASSTAASELLPCALSHCQCVLLPSVSCCALRPPAAAERALTGCTMNVSLGPRSYGSAGLMVCGLMTGSAPKRKKEKFARPINSYSITTSKHTRAKKEMRAKRSTAQHAEQRER